MSRFKFAPRLLGLLAMTIVALGASLAATAGKPPSKQTAETEYVVVVLSSPAAAHYSGGINGMPATAEAKGRFNPNSAAYHQYKAHLDNEQANFRATLNRAAPKAEAVGAFHITANAVTVKLNGATIRELEKLNGVKKVYTSTLYKPTMDQSVGLIGADTAWTMGSVGGQHSAGAGIRVGVIDSGNPSTLIPNFHEFFDCKSPELGGFFYSGDTGAPAIGIKNENGNEPAPGVAWVSDHGSHVAGTIGGCVTTIADGSVWNGVTLSGVAPGATLVDYNIFPGIGAGYTAFGGSALSHDIANAIETSVINGDHVINMSLGGGVQGPNDFLVQVSNAAVAAGTVVVTSAGNSGPGPYTVSSPGTAEDVITVGASTNSRGMGIQLTIPGPEVFRAVEGEFPNFDGSDETLIDWPGSDNEACTSDVAAGSLTGEVVLIARGSCSFSQKTANAKAAGAGGAVIYSTGAALGMARSPGFDDLIPAVSISNSDGLYVEGEIANAGGSLFPVTISPPTIVPETPNLLANFSSRGPAAFTGIVKPDVVAPGVNILSSVFFGFELFNGTSMASPHVAGAVAIVLQENPGWSPAEVKSALATTATRQAGLNPWEQGSGIIDIPAALTTNAFFMPTNASFGVFMGKAPARGSVEIAIDRSDCTVEDVEGEYVEADIAGDTLSVEFDAGRTEPAGMYGGYVTVDCAGDDHTIPWGAVVNR